MQLGPFDRRRKRSRCTRCAASHLKCSGDLPCSNCARKSLWCSYAPVVVANPIIVVDGDSGKKANKVSGKKTNTVSNQGAATRRSFPTASPDAGLVLEDGVYIYYFDVFSQRNNFTGKKRHFADDVKGLHDVHTSSFFLDSLRALGALQAAKMSGNDDQSRRKHTYNSVVSYAGAVASLRAGLEREPPRMQDAKRTVVLWTTLLLGMYELMNETTSTGWVQHMVHGTGKGLEAAGPSICKTEAGARFYLQAKMFEVCRTILFNAPTFLTWPEWARASKTVWSSEAFRESWRPLDALLDLMVSCSALRVEAGEFARRQVDMLSLEVPEEGRRLAARGVALREALWSWQAMHMNEMMGSASQLGQDDSAWLARLFFAAISIYLSGIFDWEMVHWSRWPVVQLPTLDAATVQKHTATILEVTEAALGKTTASPLLFLFPLRITGARVSSSAALRAEVLRLLRRIGDEFAVAQAVSGELGEVWEARGSGAGVEGTAEESIGSVG